MYAYTRALGSYRKSRVVVASRERAAPLRRVPEACHLFTTSVHDTRISISFESIRITIVHLVYAYMRALGSYRKSCVVVTVVNTQGGNYE